MSSIKQEAHRRSVAVAEQLEEAGVVASPYAKPIAGSAVAIFNTHNDVIKCWAGLADIEVIGDSTGKFDQAVVNVHEGDRKITRPITVDDNWSWVGDQRQRIKRVQFEAEQIAGRMFPIAIPGATFSFANAERVETRRPLSTRWDSKKRRAVRTAWDKVPGWKFEVTATAEESDLSLLVGLDEVAQFISALPESGVKSVKAAHDLLRGKKVPKNAKRQGEWFFIPASGNEKVSIERELRSRQWRDSPFANERLEHGSHHWASAMVSIAGSRYAIGVILDDRGTRHAPLVLSDWHRIERNQEQQVPTNMQQRSRTYWD